MAESYNMLFRDVHRTLTYKLLEISDSKTQVYLIVSSNVGTLP
jgi:hypothetical protein